MGSSKSGAVFRCPHCGHTSKAFHGICPECGRPFMRDSVDTRVHVRNPDQAVRVAGISWARVFLIVVVIWAAVMVFLWVYFHF